MSDGAETAQPPPGDAAATIRWRILVVDDEEIFARAVAKSLERAGHSCTTAATLGEARQRLSAGGDSYDLVILDMRLPDGKGFELLPELSALGDTAPSVVVVTAYGDISQAVEAMKAGAADYLKKPVDLDEMLVTVEKVMRSARLKSRLDYSHARETRTDAVGELLGGTPEIREVRRQIETIARIPGDAPPTVLILGETGTGKDVAARLLHRLGPRSGRPFVHVDCTALPKDMMEAELFGHVRGAFTSAHASRAGLMEAAEDGTVFLNEIGEMPLELQAKLLNVLERRHLRRVGSTREVPVQARFAAATNRDLAEMVNRGEFRDDLYFRLNVLTITMPSLRACRDDIQVLARSFLKSAARSYGRPVPALHPDAVGALKAYTWPGNVRELRNVIERALLLADDGGITAESLELAAPSAIGSRGRTRAVAAAPVAPAALVAPPAEGQTLADAEQAVIEAALHATGGNTSEAARRLGVTRMKLRYRMEKYGIRPADFAS